MKNIRVMKFILLLVVFTLSGCITTTALYGNKFELAESDVYRLKVAYGGNEYRTAGLDKKVRKRVTKEAEKFLSEHQEYNSFEILDFKRNLVPSYMVYRVKFKSE